MQKSSQPQYIRGILRNLSKEYLLLGRRHATLAVQLMHYKCITNF